MTTNEKKHTGNFKTMLKTIENSFHLTFAFELVI